MEFHVVFAFIYINMYVYMYMCVCVCSGEFSLSWLLQRSELLLRRPAGVELMFTTQLPLQRARCMRVCVRVRVRQQ